MRCKKEDENGDVHDAATAEIAMNTLLPSSEMHSNKKPFNKKCNIRITINRDTRLLENYSTMGKNENKSAKSASPTKAKPAASKSQSGTKSKGAEQTMMEVLGTFLVRGNEEPSKEKVIKVTTLAPKTTSNTIPKLKRKNLITVEGKNIRLTKDGIESLGPLAQKAGGGVTTEEVHENIKSIMTKKQIVLFEMINDGNVYEADDIARKLGYPGGGNTKAFVNLKGALKSKSIICYPDKDCIQLDLETCFPFGREKN